MEGEQDNGSTSRNSPRRQTVAGGASAHPTACERLHGSNLLMNDVSKPPPNPVMPIRKRGYARIRGPFRAFTILLLGLAGCSYALVKGGQVNLGKAEKLYAGLQDERELILTSDVPVVVMSSAQADQVLRGEVSDHTKASAFTRAAKVGAMTGLYPSGTNLKKQTMGMLNDQVAGFYDFTGNRIILVKGKSPQGALGEMESFFTHSDTAHEMLLAHELTHALQNQHFDIHKKLEQIRDNEDRKLALKSVAEGDATLASYGYVQGGLSASTIGDLVSRLGAMPKHFNEESPDTPAALRASMIFQYVDGTRFVGEAYKHGGWKAVNALYAKPPLSTRQVMNPALYFKHPEPPVKITVAGWNRALTGWREMSRNTYGELMLRVILKRNPSARAQVALARGWRGDRMVVLEKGGALTVIWIVAMRDEATAAKLARVYRGVLDGLPTSAGATPHHVSQRGNAVLAVIGEGAANYAELDPAIWHASVIQ
jgi:hypothetical protein